MEATQTQVTLKRDKECKHSVRFATNDEQSPVESVYVSRSHPGVNQAREIVLTLEIPE